MVDSFHTCTLRSTLVTVALGSTCRRWTSRMVEDLDVAGAVEVESDGVIVGLVCRTRKGPTPTSCHDILGGAASETASDVDVDVDFSAGLSVSSLVESVSLLALVSDFVVVAAASCLDASSLVLLKLS